MPDTKLSALPAGSAVASADLFYSVQGGVSVSQAASALKTFMSGMAIGGAVTGGTAGEALVVGAGPVLAQTTSLPVSVFDSGTSASKSTFWRGDGTWATSLVQPYTPAVLPGLRAWYQMDLLTGGAGSSQPTIADSSGNGFGLSQSTSSQQGTLAVADQNGLNTLLFTLANSQQYAISVSIMSGATAGSMYFVWKPRSMSAIQSQLAFGTSGNGSFWPYSNGTFYNDFGSSVRYTVGVPTASAFSAYRIYSLYSATNDFAFYVDGGTGGPTGGTSPLFSTATNTVGWLTAYPPVLGADGWVAELYFTNAKQSTADRQKNEGYLAWKWGLQGNLDPSHPYKSAPPGGTGGFMAIGDSVTGGTNKSVLFIDAAGNLAQDNPHFTFDPVTNYLNVGVSTDTGIYYLNGLPGLYQVQNVSGNNWFEGNSGNKTVTGYGNFGTGDTALANLTTGYQNVVVGASAAGGQITTGYGNTAMGAAALAACTNGIYNFAFGTSALNRLLSGNFNTAIGFNALNSVSSGHANIGVGASSLQTITTSGNNVGIGSNSLAQLSSTSGIGDGFGEHGNVAIGCNAGYNLTSSTGNNCNLLLGHHAGYDIISGGGNTIVGSWYGPSASINNVLGVGVGLNNLLLDFSYITSNVLSLQQTTTPTGFRIYNTIDAVTGPANYERACLDWNLTSNVFRIASQALGSGTVRLIAIDAFSKAGAPAAGDLPAGTCAFIDDTTNNQTWVVFNKAGTIRKVQLT